MNIPEKFTPIVPFELLEGFEEKLIRDIKTLSKQTGIRRYLLVSPGLGVWFTGFPDRITYAKFGKLLLWAQKKVASEGIELGWWCAPSLQSGKGKFQNITGITGKASNVSSCPLDSNFRRAFSSNVAEVVKIARPFLVQFEDDYNLTNHRGVNFGCFCPLHLKEFAKRSGRYYKREELLKIFGQKTPESIRLRQIWAKMSCDSLVLLASDIRGAVDKVSPETAISLCESGCSDFEGYFTGPVARAFAGAKQRPVVRVYGSSYSSDDPVNLPDILFHALYNREHLPEDFYLLHESDTYPHTRYFMSSSKLKSLITSALTFGINDSLCYITQYLDAPLEEPGYREMIASEFSRFNTLKKEVFGGKVCGCEIVHRPDAHAAIPFVKGKTPASRLTGWVHVAGMFGIPCTSKDGMVKLVAGDAVAVMSDKEILCLLSKPVFLDGRAALALSKRGFGKYIGAEVKEGGKADFCTEIITGKVPVKNISGTTMYNYIFAPAGTEGGGFFRLKPLRGAETVTAFAGPDSKPVIPGLIRYRNSFGGKVAITAFDLEENYSSAVLNYKKKEIVRQTIEWLADSELPVFVRDLPKMYCIFNRAADQKRAVCVLINLSSDTFSEVKLDLAGEWQKADISLLDKKGNWGKIALTRRAGGVTLKTECKIMSPVILKLEK